MDLPHYFFITLFPRHTATLSSNQHKIQKLRKGEKKSFVEFFYPCSTTSPSVSILKFHLSRTSLLDLLIITSTTLCNFPASSHSKTNFTIQKLLNKYNSQESINHNYNLVYSKRKKEKYNTELLEVANLSFRERELTRKLSS